MIFFTQDECAKYRAWIDELFQAEPDPEGLEIEGYNRLRIGDIVLSDLVNAKLIKKIHRDIIVLSKWFPTKYITGGGLGIHIDGEAYDGKIPSTHTILIYINGSPEFTGGRTVFVEDYIDSLTPSDHPPSSVITPEPGMALILEQNKLHFAEQLGFGAKYILRGDIHIPY